MHENVLHEFKRTISLDNVEEQVKSAISEDWLYSYLIYARCDEFGTLIEYVLKMMVAEIEEYNTISHHVATNHILDCITMYKDYAGSTKIIGYKQPPLELMIELYDPLMSKMCRKMKEHWSCYEYDDLLQICRVCMIELYNKGYYVHKQLLWTAFKNEILMQMRPMRNNVTIVSLHDRFGDADSDDKELTLMDMLTDTEEEIQEQDKKVTEGNMEIFAEVKDIIIELVGPRQFDMLFRDYSRKHTTPQSRKLLVKIKAHLKDLGITLGQMNNKYH